MTFSKENILQITRKYFDILKSHKLKSLTITALWLLAVTAHECNFDDHFFFWYATRNHSEGGLRLSQYELQKKVCLPGIGNLSGVVYHPQRKTLFMVLNNPEILLEYSLEGQMLRKIHLHGFQDTEGLTIDNNGIFSVVEERRQSLVSFHLPKERHVIDYYRDTKLIKCRLFDNDDNNNYEGLTFNPIDHSMIIGKEKEPIGIFRLAANNNKGLSLIDDFMQGTEFMDDLSDLYCKKDGGLLLLSDESALVTEISPTGKTLGFLELDRNFHKLKERIPQAEGICLDQDENIYIVSEPNLLYIFSKTISSVN